MPEITAPSTGPNALPGKPRSVIMTPKLPTRLHEDPDFLERALNKAGWVSAKR
jgi:hypothetical protein